MSLSGLFAARKRVEASIRKYEIPTEDTPAETKSCENGILLLSLLQSRLNWTNNVFPKYKSDPVQQPKRTTTTRKKWPSMKYLGTCTLELGTHVFEQTSFYKAIRVESWNTIAKSEGLDIGQESEHKLIYTDVVFELAEASNERFIFPKQVIIETKPVDYTVHVSFVLPLDQTVTESFFDTPRNKILKYGQTSDIQSIKIYAEANKPKEIDTSTEYQPVNIRITNANQAIVEALQQNTDDPAQVVETMKEKMQKLPKKSYIKFKDVEHKSEIEDLIQKASTVPDIITGPIQAEKKRNEVLNAIKLGKRPRDEKLETELSKNKQMNTKEDTLMKCAYCSTKHTHMWRPGPDGQGTLCNSCGIQWQRGEILKDAPVISKEEELKQTLERKEKEKAAEVLEVEREQKRQKAAQNIPVKRSTFERKKTEQAPAPLSLYNAAGIPLPTLSIDFGGGMQFGHPNCGITLLDRYFSVQLRKDGCEQTTINFDKSELINAQFEIVPIEVGTPIPGEVLHMKSSIAPKSIVAFNQTVEARNIHVRFLEKMDQDGIAVVLRILQRWLVTIPQQ